MEAKQHERLLHGVPSDLDDDYDPLDDLVPEKSRLARAMDGTSALSCDEQLRYMRDALFLLENDWSVYYRPGEEPEKGTCQFCHRALASNGVLLCIGGQQFIMTETTLAPVRFLATLWALAEPAGGEYLVKGDAQLFERLIGVVKGSIWTCEA
ncbi:hypothetical protein Purlil1_13789 [Purpureocillium lilacinum]|uniref:Uncharacterized protein n=1 Tax=Purpureocillium lilacinum TaxID=33203 RepID=A0ABR0BD64_PURLI|nr:hypothetical protein Purlil1_13789 [Purpureocillium lilacinum]